MLNKFFLNNGLKCQKFILSFQYNFLRNFILIYPRLIIKCLFDYRCNDFIYFYFFNFIDIFFFFFFLKNSSFFRFKVCIDFTVVDNLLNTHRFSLYYFLLSVVFNKRINLITFVKDNQHIFISLSSIYGSLNWSEREVFDMFGVFFSNHPSLRRLLTDYGFNDFPLRKDFPCSGFFEKYFSSYKGYVKYYPVKLIKLH